MDKRRLKGDKRTKKQTTGAVKQSLTKGGFKEARQAIDHLRRKR